MTDITIEDVCKEKDLLEKAIRQAIEAFQAKTRISPHSISINMIETKQIGNRRPMYLIGEVSINFKL